MKKSHWLIARLSTRTYIFWPSDSWKTFQCLKCHDLLLAVAFKVTAPAEVLMIIEGEFLLCVLFAPWLILHGFCHQHFVL